MAIYLGSIPNTHIRDYQRKKVYDAEESCVFWQDVQVLSPLKIKHLVKNITLWAEIDLPKLFFSTFKNGRYVAYATASELVLPFPLAKTIPFICHEMSHVINYQKGPADHHGPNFATIYLQLIQKFIGDKAAQELKQSFDKKKVTYRSTFPSCSTTNGKRSQYLIPSMCIYNSSSC